MACSSTSCTGYLPTPVASMESLPDYIGKLTPTTKRAEERQLVEQPRQVHHQLPEGDVRRRARRRTTTSATAGFRNSTTA